jgi:hypothetical protein
MNWDDDSSRFFNARPVIRTLPLPGDRQVVVIDDVLLDPDGLVEWAGRPAFRAPQGYPYPGVVVPGPGGLSARFADFFAQYARSALHARRTLEHDVRLSMVTTPPDRLDPRQWQCHRDRMTTDPSILFVGSVLYLFRDPALGGTSFYVPRQSPGATDRMIADSQRLDAARFEARYGLKAGYMDGPNAYFECVERVPAAWNRLILYDAGFFHSGDIGRPDLLSADPAVGRLTANGFFSCRRQAA